MAQQNGLGKIQLDSAGTGSWHIGKPPDPRAIAEAAEHGVDISGLRAWQFAADDFDRSDLILTMDRFNLDTVLAAARRRAATVSIVSFTWRLTGRRTCRTPITAGRTASNRSTRMLCEGSAALQARIAG